jgi:MFS family permease
MASRSDLGGTARVALAAAAALALADASIVTLGLPQVRVELDATIMQVAMVLGVYTGVLAVALLAAVPLARRVGAAELGAGGLIVFGLSSLACGSVDSITPLLALRGVQALGGAAALVASFDLLDGGSPGPGRRLWVAASVFGTAVGPALGGALTELFDWRAIFLAQAPIVLPGVLAFLGAARGTGSLAAAEGGAEAEPGSRIPLRPAIALGLLSAALTAVVFLVVLLLVAGWSIEPLAAALAVSVLPAAAFAASRVRGDPETRAAAGCLLVGAGIVCLALLPSASAWWTVPPQVLAGAGMGLALPALAGELMPERTRRDAARLLSIRHVGIVLALVLLAPILSSSLDDTIFTAREEGTAAVLDAGLPPETKIDMAPQLFAGIDSEDPRGELTRSVAEARGDVESDQLAEFDGLADRLDDVVTGAVRSAFRLAFVITAVFALAAGLILLAGALSPLRGVSTRGVAAGVAVAAAVVALYGIVFAGSERERVKIEDPCTVDRDLPDTGGIGGFLQDFGLSRLDDAACELDASREELLLALFDDEARDRFEEEHGVDPRSPTVLGPAALGL